MASLDREIYKTVQRIEKNQRDRDKKKSKITPALARAYGLRIDSKIKKLGRSSIGDPDTTTKLDLIAKMLMGISSGNLMNLAVSQSGGMLGKAALAKGLVTESEQLKFYSIYERNKILTFSQVQFVNNLYEKLFDGVFDAKTSQEEALEFLQTIGKMVDGRKVNVDKVTLRNGVYALVQRPMTAIGNGYMIVKIVDDGSNKVADGNEVTINPVIERKVSGIEKIRDVQAKVVKNYNGPKEYKEGTSIFISPFDTYAVSEDNKRFYLTYIPTHNKDLADKINANGKSKEGLEDVIDDFEDDVDDVRQGLKKLQKKVTKESLNEKYLSNDEIQDLIDSIKKKLKNRPDKDARGMLSLTKDIEKTLKEKGKLHPNSVIAIQRIATGVSGSWGVNSPDWTGKSPSGRLNKYPPSPTKYVSSAR